jgi:hypothetical protein
MQAGPAMLALFCWRLEKIQTRIFLQATKIEHPRNEPTLYGLGIVSTRHTERMFSVIYPLNGHRNWDSGALFIGRHTRSPHLKKSESGIAGWSVFSW